MQCFCNFLCSGITKQFKTSQNIRRQNIQQNFFHFIDQSHSVNSRQIEKQILPTLVILKLSYLRKNHSWKMEVLRIFASWDQEIDSSFTNHEPLFPTLLVMVFHCFGNPTSNTFFKHYHHVQSVINSNLNLSCILNFAFYLCSKYSSSLQ